MPITDYYVTTDAMGSVMAVLDESGNVLERRSYDAFGEATYMLADGTVVPDSPTGVDIGFQGQLMDELTGLYQMGYRWYSPVLGRWVSPDPIGLAGGVNTMEFVGNRPNIFHDHDGLAPIEFGDSNYISQQAVRADRARRANQAAACRKKRAERMAAVDKLVATHPGTPVSCEAENGCERITVLIAIADPCDSFPSNLAGHAGLGIGPEYYDFGPIGDATLFDAGSQWWDRPDAKSWHDNLPGVPPSQINLSNITKNLGSLSSEPVVLLEYCACKAAADSARKYWSNLYAQISSGSVNWSPFNLSCSSAVCESLTGERPMISPDELLESLASKLTNTCGSAKGGKASMRVMTRAFQTRKW